jgi:Vacuolar H+-ATPase V1 sector, subunit H
MNSVLDKLNAKISIMKLIDSENPQVKEQALVAIQKIMLNSWESASITTADDEKAQAK